MKKMVLSLMIMATLAVAHPERKAPPPPRKSQPVKVIKKTTVRRPVSRPMMTPFRQHAHGDRFYVTYHNEDYTEYRNHVIACRNGHCNTFEFKSVDDYPTQLVITTNYGKMYFDKSIYDLEVVTYH